MTSIITRQQHHHHQPRHPHQTITHYLAISPPTAKRSPLTTPRTGSRNRSNRSSISESHDIRDGSMQETGATGSQPLTPTPKKGGGRQRRGQGTQGRKARGKRGEDDTGTEDVDADGEGVEEEGNDSLFDLLGVTSPPVVEGAGGALEKAGKGILAISKADIERSGNGNGQEKKGRVQRTRQDGPETGAETKQRGGRRDKNLGTLNVKQDHDAGSEGEAKRTHQPRKPKNKLDDSSALSASTSSPIVTTPVSALSATRPKGGARRQGRGTAIAEPIRQESSDEAFETASLSQSLPSERLFGPSRSGPLDQGGSGAANNGKRKAKGKKGNSAAQDDDGPVWEMPEVPGPSANQALTWQQKLQSSTTTTDSPRRSNKSTPQSHAGSTSISSPGHANLLDRKGRSRPHTSSVNSPHPPSAMPSSPLVSRPTHARRASLDNNVPVSAFDHTLPFHTGFNVHRAPQTPAKLPGNMAPAHHLPILHQEFPRIGKGSGPSAYSPAPPIAPGIIPMPPVSTPAHAKIKYAGPTFHNSPHGASLPKPDLDDF